MSQKIKLANQLFNNGDYSKALLLYEQEYQRRVDVLSNSLIININASKKRILKTGNGKDDFDTEFYIFKNPDVAKNNINPLQHYDRYGKNEGRCPNYYTMLSREKSINQKFISSNSIISNSDYSEKKIAVHAHIFYADLCDEFSSYLNNIPQTFDLYISVVRDEDIFTCKNAFCNIEHLNNLKIKKTPNLGRDIGPMICEFGEELLTYDYICHIHTKKSLADIGNGEKFHFWREYNLKKLLGSKEAVKNIFKLLAQPNAGLVFPEAYWGLPERNISTSWFGRAAILKEHLQKFGIKNWRMLPENIAFPTGTMFWANSESLVKILKNNINYSDFPIEEKGKIDDFTLAHAIERLIGYLPAISGYTNYILKREKLLSKRDFINQIPFDAIGYTKLYADVKEAGLDPIEHFKKNGVFEGRLPGLIFEKKDLQQVFSVEDIGDFSSIDYLKSYPNFWDAIFLGGITPYEHYSKLGKSLGIPENFNALKLLQKQGLDKSIKFSIVIPVFNSKSYLYTCLKSAYEQSWKNIEVVIVDDGSTDGSQEVIEKFRNKYPQLTKVVLHKKNKGLAITHKDGIDLVTGKYFAVLDGDDWLDPYFAESMCEIAEAYSLDAVSCGWARPKKFGLSAIARKEWPIDLRLLDGDKKISAIVNWKGAPNIHYGLNRKIYNVNKWREIDPIKGLNHKIIAWEDAIVTTEFFQRCGRVGWIKNPLYFWYFNPDSVGNKPLTRQFVDESIFALKTIFDNIVADNVGHALYERHCDNIIKTELMNRLWQDVKNKRENSEDLIFYLAAQLDKYKNIFDINFLGNLKVNLVRICSLLFSEAKKENFILFVDPSGIQDIKNHLLPIFNDKINIAYKYMQCSESANFIELMSYVKDGHLATMVVTSGGWGENQFHTNKPVFQIWHGMGAIKKVKPHPARIPTKLGVCSSEYVRDVYSELFNLNKSQVLPIGCIQSDIYFNEEKISNSRALMFEKYPALEGKRVYVWCPTFRGKSPNIYEKDKLDFEKIKFLLKDDEVFVYKRHPALSDYTNSNGTESTVSDKILNLRDEDILSLISIANVFVTDYSSSIHYAILRNVPVVLLATDIDDYELELDYREDMPGEIIETVDENLLINALRRASSDNKKYREFKRFHLGNCDGRSGERLLREISNFYKLNK